MRKFTVESIIVMALGLISGILFIIGGASLGNAGEDLARSRSSDFGRLTDFIQEIGSYGEAVSFIAYAMGVGVIMFSFGFGFSLAKPPAS